MNIVRWEKSVEMVIVNLKGLRHLEVPLNKNSQNLLNIPRLNFFKKRPTGIGFFVSLKNIKSKIQNLSLTIGGRRVMYKPIIRTRVSVHSLHYRLF